MGKTSGVTESNVADSYVNFSARLGYGQDNQASDGTYQVNYKSRSRYELEAAYRSSWIAATVVDLPVDDMIRVGIEFEGDAEPDELTMLSDEFTRLDCLRSLADNARWARLYGGSVALLMIKGHDVTAPLNLDAVGKGDFLGLFALDRWRAMPSLASLVTDFGPDFGMPEFYDVQGDGVTPAMRVHYSRVIRMEGDGLPHYQRIAEMGWGQSVLERLWDRLLAFDSTTHGASQLVFKAHLRTYSVEGLRDIIATGGKTLDGLLANIDMIRRYQSSEGMTLLDGTDKLEVQQATFSGLSDMMLQMAQQISGAGQIPLVRLLGQSPAGMNSTGESDIRTYYDNVSAMRSAMLSRGMRTITELLCRSVLGRAAEGVTFSFPPLWELSEIEKASYAGAVTTAILACEAQGVIDRTTALKELRQAGEKVGIYSNITDEIIEESEGDPAPDFSES